MLPRPESLPFVRGREVFRRDRVRGPPPLSRRDTFDASLYGSKVRGLIDDHVDALGIEQKIPPISITAADFDSKVADLHSDRAKASEMEHAIRYHLREHCDETRSTTPAVGTPGADSRRTGGAVGAARPGPRVTSCPRSRAGRQADDSGLNPVTEAPFYDLLRRELADEGGPCPPRPEALSAGA